MARRLTIGLTGGIASGKSTVSDRFKELGVPVIDADESARSVVSPGTNGFELVLDMFGPDLVTPRGELDRRAIREIVFSQPKRRLELEALLHPLIREDMERRSVLAVGPYIVLSIPLLLETNGKDRVDRVLVIDIEREVQLTRLMRRDNLNKQQARAILDAQTSREKRLAIANDVISNAGSVETLRLSVDKIHSHYVELANFSNLQP